MYFTTTTFLTLIASIPMILGSPILETRQSGTICQTSNGSPETKEVTDVINQLRGQGGLCPQINPGNSDCTTLVSHNSAAITICGGVEDELTGGRPCEDIAKDAMEIQHECNNKGTPVRAGGTFFIDQGMRVEVINSAST